MTTSFSRWNKQINQNKKLQKQKQTLYKLTKQKLGDCTWNGTRLEGDEALDEERRQNIEQLSGFKKKHLQEINLEFPQWRVVANAMDSCTLPIFSKLVFQEVCR